VLACFCFGSGGDRQRSVYPADTSDMTHRPVGLPHKRDR
jgi:hypothetical protein